MCLNVYDVALDFLLLDAFDDLSSPPSAVLNITKSGWIPTAAKQGVSAVPKSFSFGDQVLHAMTCCDISFIN